jgi:hypothetical protein
MIVVTFFFLGCFCAGLAFIGGVLSAIDWLDRHERRKPAPPRVIVIHDRDDAPPPLPKQPRNYHGRN